MESRGYKCLVALSSLLLLLVFINGCLGEDSHHGAESTTESSGNGSLKCYVCNSHKDANCEKNLQPEQIQECPEGSTGCWKIEQMVPYDEGNNKAHERVIRKCANQTQSTRKCLYRSGYGASMNYCFCNSTSLCNGSWQLAGNPLLAVLSGSFMLLVLKAIY